MADKQDENESNKRVIYTYPMVKQVIILHIFVRIVSEIICNSFNVEVLFVGMKINQLNLAGGVKMQTCRSKTVLWIH